MPAPDTNILSEQEVNIDFSIVPVPSCYAFLNNKYKPLAISNNNNNNNTHLLQVLTVGAASSSVAFTATRISTTAHTTTKPRRPPRSAKKTLWLWPTRSREYKAWKGKKYTELKRIKDKRTCFFCYEKEGGVKQLYCVMPMH